MGMRQGMQASPEQASQAPKEPGNASKLLVGIHDQMAQLGEIILASNLPEEDKQAYAQLMQGFMSFADSLTGGAPTNKRADMGNVPEQTMGTPARQAM